MSDDFIDGFVLQGAILLLTFAAGVLAGIWGTMKSLRAGVQNEAQNDDDTGPGLHGPLKGYYK
jgi:hypothetical protein